MPSRKVLSEADIEEFAAQRRHEYQLKVGWATVDGISAEDAAFRLLNIDIDWESFKDDSRLGRTELPHFGKPARLVLNEDHLDQRFLDTPNLQNTVIAHELGHLFLHVDHGKAQQLQLCLEHVEQIVVPVSMLFDPLRIPSSDEEWREWQAHTFMRHFLVPRNRLLNAIGNRQISSWTDIGELAAQFLVTKAVMKIQIDKLRAWKPNLVTNEYPIKRGRL